MWKISWSCEVYNLAFYASFWLFSLKKHRGKWQFKNSVVSRRRRRWAEGHLLLINLRKKIQKLEFLNPKTKKKNLQELNVRRSHFFSWLNFAPFFLLNRTIQPWAGKVILTISCWTPKWWRTRSSVDTTEIFGLLPAISRWEFCILI